MAHLSRSTFLNALGILLAWPANFIKPRWPSRVVVGTISSLVNSQIPTEPPSSMDILKNASLTRHLRIRSPCLRQGEIGPRNHTSAGLELRLSSTSCRQRNGARKRRSEKVGTARWNIPWGRRQPYGRPWRSTTKTIVSGGISALIATGMTLSDFQRSGHHTTRRLPGRAIKRSVRFAPGSESSP